MRVFHVRGIALCGLLWLFAGMVFASLLGSFFPRSGVTFFRRSLFMRKRGGMSRGHSKSVFRKGAQRVHRKNGMLNSSNPMRGGIRL